VARKNLGQRAISATGTNDYKGSAKRRESWDDLQGWDELPFG